ncbi:RDAC family protein [Thomasclavelia sp.]
MSSVVDFNMIVELNQLLKNKGIEYSIHAVGGCICAGLYLRQDGEMYSFEEIVLVINEYLDDKWMKVIPKLSDPFLLDVVSKFSYEDK